MAHKHITQVGLNRILWKMLAALGGKFTVTDREIQELANSKVAIKIDYTQSDDLYTLQLAKVSDDKPASSLILPQNMN